MKKISIIIPLFNEEKNIEILLKEVFDTIKEKYLFEIICVNDCSSDNSKKILQKLSSDFPLKIINNMKNLGQSYSIFSGIRKSKYKTIVTLDGDCQNNPKDIPKIVEKYFSSNSIYLVGGIRKKRKDSFIKIFSSKIANNIRNLILQDNCIDTGCSLKAFDKDTFLKFPYFDGIHRFLPALFKGYGKETFFLDVDHRQRIYGKSKYGTIIRTIKGIRDIIKVVIILKKFKKKND